MLKSVLCCLLWAFYLFLGTLFILIAFCGYILALADLPQAEAYKAFEACLIVSSIVSGIAFFTLLTTD